MAAHEHLGVQFPYPRLREAWAINYSNDWAKTFNEEGNPVHPLSILPQGRNRAQDLAESAMEDRGRKTWDGKPLPGFPATNLIEEGFKKRHKAKEVYSSWVN